MPKLRCNSPEQDVKLLRFPRLNVISLHHFTTKQKQRVYYSTHRGAFVIGCNKQFNASFGIFKRREEY